MLQGLGDTRVIALVGARQVGKSTLVRHLSGSTDGYYTFDDLGTLAAANEDPAALIRSLPRGAIIDEVQKLLNGLSAIKAAVDTDPVPGRLIITGSANLLTIPKLSESLAGRTELFTLYPLSQAEIQKSTGNFVDAIFSAEPWGHKGIEETPERTIGRVMSGGYPEALNRENETRRNSWFHSYVTTKLQRDMREISAISEMRARAPRRSQRESDRRCQSSEHRRLKHTERARRYRQRCRNVTEHSVVVSLEQDVPTTSARSEVSTPSSAEGTATTLASESSTDEIAHLHQVNCHFCRRWCDQWIRRPPLRFRRSEPRRESRRGRSIRAA